MSGPDMKKPASPHNDAGPRPNPKQEETSRSEGAATTADNEAAISFLYLMHPEGPWILSAIDPETRRITTKPFGPETESAARAFLADHNGRRNVYFSVAT